MNKLSRLICAVVAGLPFAIYFFAHFGYMKIDISDQLYEDIVITTTGSHTHKPPVTKPSSDAIIMSHATNNISSMVNLCKKERF